MSLARRAVLQQRHLFHGTQPRLQYFPTSIARQCQPRPWPLQLRFQTTYTHPEQPVRRSIAGRILRSLFTATFFTTVGIYIGWVTLRSRPEIAAILSPAPSNEETLSMFEAKDAFTAEVNTHITKHSLAEQLRKRPNLEESRPHLKIPEPIRATNLTAGTLNGPGRLVVPPLVFSDKEGQEMYVLFYLGEQLCGHPGIIHGGMLATLLDEGLARCCFAALPNKVGVTANLKINYKKPTKAGDYYVLKAYTTKVDGRKAWVNGWIERLDTATVEETGEKYVEAEALFIEPRNAAVMRRLYAAG